MRRIDILLTGELGGGMTSFSHGEVEIRFHLLSEVDKLPLIEGNLWAFVGWVLPTMSGLELCRRLRADPVTADAHVTIVLDDDDQEARRRALRCGADDYIMGPISRSMVLDRVLSMNVLDDSEALPRIIQLGDLRINVTAHQACWKDHPIALMPNELRLLRYFAEHPGQVFSRSQLIAALGKQQTPLDERTVDVWIGRLRKALGAAGAEHCLRTVRSLGYILDG